MQTRTKLYLIHSFLNKYYSKPNYWTQYCENSKIISLHGLTPKEVNYMRIHRCKLTDKFNDETKVLKALRQGKYTPSGTVYKAPRNWRSLFKWDFIMKLKAKEYARCIGYPIERSTLQILQRRERIMKAVMLNRTKDIHFRSEEYWVKEFQRVSKEFPTQLKHQLPRLNDSMF